MSEKLIKKDLIKEIDAISDTDFEKICFEIFKQKFPEATVLHNGINIDERPVKGTVDISNDNLEICMECSVEKDYFTDINYSKIDKDIQHVLKLSNNNVSEIYLYCSHVEIPSFRKEWIKSAIYRKYKSQNISIEILGGKNIANEIYNFSVEKRSLYSTFNSILPDFKKNMERVLVPVENRHSVTG